jgi:beta propeller repeat protein
MNSHQLDPAIDGNFVVWVEHYPTPWRINGYSLSGHTKFLIWGEDESKNTPYPPYIPFYCPAVSGNTVVWWGSGYTSTDNRTMVYDFYNRTITTCNGLYPNISGGIVVYEHHEAPPYGNESYKICYTDFSKPGKYEPYSHCITYNDPNWCQSNYCNYAEGTDPDISGNIIVWTRWWEFEHLYGHDIYGYDISTRTWFSICGISQWHENPAIDGNIVIWQDHRNGNWDIYGARLEPFCLEKPEMDFNGDCKVDFADLAIMASSWLECNLVPQSACWE